MNPQDVTILNYLADFTYTQFVAKRRIYLHISGLY
jgi:hypothetical protein